jgi:hypothetical protein
MGIEIVAGGALRSPAGGVPGVGAGGLAHAASNPRIAADRAGRAPVPRAKFPRVARTFDMWVILLEAFGAMLILIVIVWWTMFAGRKRGERRDD